MKKGYIISMNSSDSFFYLVNENINISGYIGVKTKILSQASVFAKHFPRVLIAYYANGIAYLCDMEIVIEKKLALSRVECFAVFLNWMSIYQCKWVYIRCLIPASRIYIDFLKKMHEKGVKAVLEYPTYPYEGEIQDEAVLREDRFYRDEIKKYISLVTVYSLVPNIYGINAHVLQNGVRVEDNPVRSIKKKSNKIIMLAVANFYFHHGYERVLEGMRNYYQNKHEYEIYFDMIGEGSERRYYEYLVKKYSLQKYVSFLGIQSGGSLDNYYNRADIGVAPLGLHKCNTVYSAPIKTREYCVRGIPFIYGYSDIGFTGDEPFVIRISNDSVPLDMDVVIALYERTVGRVDLVHDMRKLAEEKFTWDVLLRQVIGYLK
ncbi:MAG: glycosyltransferase [Lachnospiraceae bacterium]|nr:glycosyltransferase [Lachnospiraceae bacterium]